MIGGKPKTKLKMTRTIGAIEKKSRYRCETKANKNDKIENSMGFFADGVTNLKIARFSTHWERMPTVILSRARMK